jgi:UrcA family protein
MKAIFLAAAATAACLMAIGGPVAAQAPAAEPSETVDVVAPYVVEPKTPPPRRQINGTYMELVETDMRVSFSDLDLKNPADQATLEARVKTAAGNACAYLDRRYPEGTYRPVGVNRRCVQTATDEAMVQVKQLIAAANEN